MKFIFIYILSLLPCLVFSQNVRTKVPESWKQENPDFSSQGEQEDYWAWKLFLKEYKFSSYSRYSGKITEEDNTIYFASSTIQCDCGVDLKPVFTEGILYPEILGMERFKINNLEELHFLNTSSKIKRFRFWLWNNQLINPQVYFFELQNNDATEFTPIEVFLKGAKLTFLKKGWLII